MEKRWAPYVGNAGEGTRIVEFVVEDFRLPVRTVEPRIGKVTRGRKDRPQTSQHDAPVGYDVPYYGPLVKRATEEMIDVVLKKETLLSSTIPDWWPRDNEELCRPGG